MPRLVSKFALVQCYVHPLKDCITWTKKNVYKTGDIIHATYLKACDWMIFSLFLFVCFFSPGFLDSERQLCRIRKRVASLDPPPLYFISLFLYLPVPILYVHCNGDDDDDDEIKSK